MSHIIAVSVHWFMYVRSAGVALVFHMPKRRIGESTMFSPLDNIYNMLFRCVLFCFSFHFIRFTCPDICKIRISGIFYSLCIARLDPCDECVDENIEFACNSLHFLHSYHTIGWQRWHLQKKAIQVGQLLTSQPVSHELLNIFAFILCQGINRTKTRTTSRKE